MSEKKALNKSTSVQAMQTMILIKTSLFAAHRARGAECDAAWAMVGSDLQWLAKNGKIFELPISEENAAD